jgi:nucleoside-diphosphate-sugar epimerase
LLALGKRKVKGKLCVVTGGAGFIGSHLVRRLLELGADVRVIDNLSTGRKENIPAGVLLYEEDINWAFTAALTGADYVFHLAAKGSVPGSIAEPLAWNYSNVTGTLVMLDKCLKIDTLKKFVFTSSSSVHGGTEDGFPSPYALQKAVGEHYVDMYHRLYGLPAIGIRPFNVFGERQRADGAYAAVIPKFIEAALKGEDLIINGDGLQTRDFTPVENVVDAYILAAQAPDSSNGFCYDVGCGRKTSVLDLALEIIVASGSVSDFRHVEARLGDARESCAHLPTTQEAIGYRPKLGWSRALTDLVRRHGDFKAS